MTNPLEKDKGADGLDSMASDADVVTNPPVKDITAEIRELLEHPDEWLDTENSRTMGKKPRSLIGTPDEEILWNIVEGSKHGFMT